MLAFRSTPYFDYFEDARVLGQEARRQRSLTPQVLEAHGLVDPVDDNTSLLLALELEDRIGALESQLEALSARIYGDHV